MEKAPSATGDAIGDRALDALETPPCAPTAGMHAIRAEFDEQTAASDYETVTSPRPSSGSSRAPAHLIVLTGSDAGRTFPLESAAVIGRAPDADIRLKASDSSRKHARIVATHGDFILEDLDSRNGTSLNGVPVQRAKLKFGDQIGIGAKSLFLFSYHDHLGDQIRQMQKMEAIGRLAGGIAHDFNNLLATVSMNMDFLLQLAHYDRQTVRECVADVKGAAARGRDLIRQLLGFAQHGSYQQRPVDVSGLVHEVLRLIRRTAEQVVIIDLQVASDLWTVGDHSQLHQVLMNLCINAIDAMSDGGTMHVVVQPLTLLASDTAKYSPLRPGQYSLIRVEDTGIGMDQETLSRVFEPFFSTKGGKGSGLGLATVFGIVRNHGGIVRVESELGLGSRFEVVLPAAKAPHSAPAPPARAAPLIRADGRAILVVDDEPAVRQSCARLLRQFGHEVLVAAGGEQAVAIFEQQHDRIALVLLDLVMPHMNGETTFEKLKQLDPRVGVVILSGCSEEDRLRRLLDAGARAYLRKPFGMDALRATLDETLNEGTTD